MIDGILIGFRMKSRRRVYWVPLGGSDSLLVEAQPLTPAKSASGNLPYVLVITWLYSRLHVEVAAWADTYAALFANFALTPNCVCHVQPVRAEQPSEFGALARQGRVTGYPSDNHRITIFL